MRHMGWLDDIGDAVSSAAGAVGDAVSGAVDGVTSAVGDTVDTVIDTAQDGLAAANGWGCRSRLSIACSGSILRRLRCGSGIGTARSIFMRWRA
jgi:hypothetical protein